MSRATDRADVLGLLVPFAGEIGVGLGLLGVLANGGGGAGTDRRNAGMVEEGVMAEDWEFFFGVEVGGKRGERGHQDLGDYGGLREACSLGL